MSDKQTPPRSWSGLLGESRTPPPASHTTAPSAPVPDPPMQDAEAGREYRAFSSDRGQRQRLTVEIRYFEPRLNIEEGYLLSMPHFVQAHFIGHEHVILHFQHTVFEIEGRGVRQLVDLMKQGALATIQEYNAQRWPEPAPDQPKITRITAITPEQVAALTSDRLGRERAPERPR